MVKSRYIHSLDVWHMSDISNRTRVKKRLTVKKIAVNHATEMVDLCRHLKWKYSKMACRQFMEYRRNIVGLNWMRFFASSWLYPVGLMSDLPVSELSIWPHYLHDDHCRKMLLLIEEFWGEMILQIRDRKYFTLSLYGKWRLGDALIIPYMVNIVKVIRIRETNV